MFKNMFKIFILSICRARKGDMKNKTFSVTYSHLSLY